MRECTSPKLAFPPINQSLHDVVISEIQAARFPLDWCQAAECPCLIFPVRLGSRTSGLCSCPKKELCNKVTTLWYGFLQLSLYKTDILILPFVYKSNQDCAATKPTYGPRRHTQERSQAISEPKKLFSSYLVYFCYNSIKEKLHWSKRMQDVLELWNCQTSKKF